MDPEYDPFQILWQGKGEGHLLAGFGVGEGEPCGVKEKPSFRKSVKRGRGPAVAFVAHQGMPRPSQVDADLMGHSGDEIDLDQGVIGEDL